MLFFKKKLLHRDNKLMKRKVNKYKKAGVNIDEGSNFIKSINKQLKNSKIKDMLTNILGFHKREDDIFWQDIFRRASSKNDEDLIEDAKCIGNMEIINDPEADPNDSKGHNKIYTYRFEKQDYKIKENKSVLKGKGAPTHLPTKRKNESLTSSSVVGRSE